VAKNKTRCTNVAENKTRCTYSSGQGEVATPLALHVVEVLELLKASPMANIQLSC